MKLTTLITHLNYDFDPQCFELLLLELQLSITERSLIPFPSTLD